MTDSQTPADPFAAGPQQLPTPPASPAPQGYAQPPAAPGYAAPQYGAPQYGAPAFPMYGPRPDAKNWMGIVALVGGILGLTFMVPLLGSLAGVIFGHLGLGAVKRGEATNRGLALAGVILGYVGLLVGVIVVIAYISFFAVAASSGWTEGAIAA